MVGCAAPDGGSVALGLGSHVHRRRTQVTIRWALKPGHWAACL